MEKTSSQSTFVRRNVGADSDGIQLNGLKNAAKRRWKLILSCATLVPLVVMGVVETLPSQYTSKATIVLMQGQIPKQYVDQMAVGSSAEMINGVTRQVLSVPRLAGIVERFGLFPELKQKLTGEQLGEELRKQIVIRPVDQLTPKADYTAFAISFGWEDPKIAQQILSQLCTLFVEVNLQDREAQSRSTTTFLKNQVDISRKRLEEQEQALLAARVANAAQNPSLNAAKLSLQADLRIQLQMNAANISRLQQQQASIEATMMAAIARLEQEKRTLLATYTPQHPEVRARTAEIEALQRALKRGNDGGKSEATLTDPVLADMRAQLERSQREITTLTENAKTLRDELAKYNQTLLQSSPLSEQQLAVAQKDYDLLRQEFAELQTKYFRSQVAANLEEQQSGHNFRLVDPPTLPSMPSSPNRLRISLIALAAGLAIGVLAAFGSEIIWPNYLTYKDFTSAYPSLLVINVPLMLTVTEQKKLTVQNILFICGGVVAAVVMAAWMYRMYTNDIM